MVANGTGGPGFAVPAMVAVHAESRAHSIAPIAATRLSIHRSNPRPACCAWGLREGW